MRCLSPRSAVMTPFSGKIRSARSNTCASVSGYDDIKPCMAATLLRRDDAPNVPDGRNRRGGKGKCLEDARRHLRFLTQHKARAFRACQTWPPMAATSQGRDDVQPVANETLDRFLTGTVTVIPILALGLVAWQLRHRLLGWSDLIVFAIMYVSTGLGVTV